MKRTPRDLLLVGLFMVVGVSVLGGGLLWIAGARIFRSVDRYTVVFDRSVSGLAPGATVEFQGVAVGRVEGIGLTQGLPPRVAVVLAVSPNTPLRRDTTAVLAGSLVTGIKFIQLSGGSEAAGELPTGSEITGDTASLEQFRDRLTEGIDRATRILQRLEEQVLTTENTTRLSSFVQDVTAISEGLRETMETFRREDTGRSLAQVVKQTSGVAEKLDRLLASVEGQKDDVLSGMTTALKNLNLAVTDARKLLETLTQQVALTSGSVATLISDLGLVTGRLEETVDLIRSDPSLLLRGRDVPEREKR